MIRSTSFIDLLFILLCGTIVMLTQSFNLKGLKARPAQVGGGAVSDILADDVRIVGITDDELMLAEGSYHDVDTLLAALTPRDVIVLVPADEFVSHHRVMQVWSQFSQRGHQPQIGVQRTIGAPGRRQLSER